MADASIWGRWHWRDRGLGRWHAIVRETQGLTGEGKTVDAVVLACGRVRAAPKVTAPRPSGEKCCPQCATLDDLRQSYKPETVEDPVLVPVMAGAHGN